MLEIINTITSLLKESVAAIEKVAGHFDQKKKRHLAQTLHLVYLRLNECIVIGDQIIDSLDKFVLYKENVLSYARRYQFAIDGIVFDDLMLKQIQNLRSLDDCLNDYSEIIKALDADLYTRIAQFGAYKGVGLHWIAVLLERGKIPFDGLDIEDVNRLADISQFMLRSNQGEIRSEAQ